jgi:glycosyltransferase involved in cell wall biosynthesis
MLANPARSHRREDFSHAPRAERIRREETLPMKVLHVSPYFIPARRYGGLVEAAYRLCLSVSRAGCDVRVLTTNANGRDRVLSLNPNREHPIASGFDVRYCPRKMRTAVSPALVRHMLSYARWADVVHLSAVYSFTTFPTLLAARALHKPLVWSPHGALQRWRGSRRRLTKVAWERACRIAMPRKVVLHLTAEQERDESMARFPGRETVVIPNGVTIPRRLAPQPGDGTMRLGFIGRLDPKKGIERLVDAVGLLRDEQLIVKLALAGSGEAFYEDALKGRVRKMGLEPQVTFVGQVSGQAKRHFFEAIDLAVVPSHTENFGIVVAEALAHSVPVVASKGMPWQRLEERGCGLWVDNSPASIAHAIRQMTSAPLAEMGRRGREWMIEEFSWERVARDMCEVYSTLLFGKKLLSPAADSVSLA